MIWRLLRTAIILVVAFICGTGLNAIVDGMRAPVDTILVTEEGNFIIGRTSARCMDVVAALEHGDEVVMPDPWGARHTIVAVSCSRGTENIGRAFRKEAATEQ